MTVSICSKATTRAHCYYLKEASLTKICIYVYTHNESVFKLFCILSCLILFIYYYSFSLPCCVTEAGPIPAPGGAPTPTPIP